MFSLKSSLQFSTFGPVFERKWFLSPLLVISARIIFGHLLTCQLSQKLYEFLFSFSFFSMISVFLLLLPNKFLQVIFLLHSELLMKLCQKNGVRYWDFGLPHCSRKRKTLICIFTARISMSTRKSNFSNL